LIVGEGVDDQFERVRREVDPLRQAQLAGELIATYQQRSVELARLRREAINRAREEKGLNFAAIAGKLGLTRGRITQIRQTAPPPERALFGVGPVTVAIPNRLLAGRALPVISSEDARAADLLTELLTDLAFGIDRFRIPPSGEWEPHGDVVAICGPKSSPVTAQAIASDPVLRFDPDHAGKWTIRERDNSRSYESPMDDLDAPTWSDVAYVGRLALPTGQLIFVVAGVHALGSVGAIDYLRRHVAELYAQVGTHRFSMVVASDHDGETVTRSELLCAPRVHG
jgi:transcriptional regulator with XRE-family HTH domain